MADAAAPKLAPEGGIMPPVGVASMISLLGGIVRLLLAAASCAEQSHHRANARRAAARSVCTALTYFGSDWAWSNTALQAEATALVVAVGRAVSIAGAAPPAPPHSETVALSAAVFGQLTEIVEALQRLPVVVASAASCRIVRLATTETAGSAMSIVPMMVPTIESSEWSLKLDGLLSVHHIVHIATPAELNWEREALAGMLLRALVFWEEDALSLSAPAAVRAMTTIHVLHGGANSAEGAASLNACERLAVELIRALGLVENDEQRQIILKGLAEMVESTHLMMTQFLPVSLHLSGANSTCTV